MKRVLVRHFVGLLAVVLAAASAHAAPPQETLTVSGLKEQVQIIRDRWGIPHIYAKNESDLFFAQGYNIARDRLFQLELWRRQATGTVAEILGPKELKRDIGNRLFAYRGDFKQELNWYHPRGAEIIDAFVAGINAYIAETERNPSLLTPEFKMLGVRAGRWTPASVISRFNGLLGNIGEELNMVQAIRTIGVEGVRQLEYFQPANPQLELDAAIDASLLNRDVISLYNSFRTPILFTPDALIAEFRGKGEPSGLVQIDEVAAFPSAVDLSQRREDIGSNNWVVAGKRTASGFPLVAGDPHRIQEVPSLRYWVHLVAPGWDVIGAGEPALPGVSMGHNQFGAWGLTIFGNDMEDLYVYDTNPSNTSEYKYQGGWESMTVIKDMIPVKGQAPAAIELKYTRHGPVVWEDAKHHKAYAIRAAWRELGGAPYLASLRMDQAKTWEEFRDACEYSRVPAENMVWGDIYGNIGYQAVGITPQRPNWSGLVPVPGDGRYEWNGFLPIKALPHVLNPEKGYFNTSNNYLIPSQWEYREALHYLWADPYRADSVEEVLNSGRMFTVPDMVQLQNNDLSIPARQLVPLLRNLSPVNTATQKAQDLLLHWDNVLDANSVPAGIYEMWQRRLLANVRAVVVPKAAEAFIGGPAMSQLVRWLYAPDGRFGPDPISGRDALLIRSLDQAVAELTKRLGPETEKWKLGAYHHALILHLLSPALKPELKAKFDVGDLPRGGDSYTITATGGADNQTNGGSIKFVMDTENWDNSVALNNPGQSGDVNSTHYRDHYEFWARGRYFPIFYSKTKIDSVAEQVTTLQPSL
ncbi:MAG: penicillin acylase family protein, partial [Blastocatellia bacterium]|nr:penicillin acylase family protein [Blastocatellia bacterium]